MAASRLLLLRSPFFCIYRNATAPSSLSNLHTLSLRTLLSAPRPRAKPSLLQRLQFHSDSSTAATASRAFADNPAEPSEAVNHPWPEWVNFLEQLKSKGYFDADDGTSLPTETEEGSSTAFPKDSNRLKTACLSFARERFDILRSLSKKDIQDVVECGCPNLLRKAVNSAKRLRAYVKLDEGEVCSGCNLRGSCDRAYVIAKEGEDARTVDIVRILLSYAIDPLVLSGGEKPHGREHVEASARRLLSKLIELSDTARDPSLPKSAVKSVVEKQRNISDCDKQFLNVEMKRGDWICCKCNFMNFSRNIRCLQCREEGPKRVSFDDVEMKKGDWACPQCQFMNFARNKNCLRCQESRPKRELSPGEWECPSCDFLNYRRNMVCLKCNCKRPKDEVAQYEDQIWRKPKVATRLSHGDSEDDNEGSDNELTDAMAQTGRKKRFSFSKMETSKRRFP
ncbi:zinc finger protein VAR3, chloroplastic [Magnolia sinica]|uniref:zinc finger protein VAR3, chloroplastic n=1 Tax=Magnolia sinica TaxID=86752 RepID=UPI002657E0A6|nr:zinc finger protein VAR3, chloroplastic [Magnolia sinica]XP_058108098.1 zinc finger protein VAR3, chloroplastic [Magnolia sinica]XP_058108099.1 zinc finger protein VAR3, chloroplastic [Magnolia sinica]XP_058108100.1 zinc finger protein VAR3, chloroplastic [Magnolia sinica]